MSSPRIIRLDASDLGPWTSIRQPGVIDADAQSRGRVHFDEKRGAARVYSGVWEATPHVEKIADFPMDEIMFVLEGSCTIVDDTGHAETFAAGDAFLMPKGFTGEWRQDETMRKFYLIADYSAA